MTTHVVGKHHHNLIELVLTRSRRGWSQRVVVGRERHVTRENLALNVDYVCNESLCTVLQWLELDFDNGVFVVQQSEPEHSSTPSSEEDGS